MNEVIKISGYVEHIIYRNPENGYTVLEVSAKEKTLTLVGSLFYINEGEYVEAEGRLTSHALYGEQLQVISANVTEPKDLASIERYLASGAVKGIGQALAGRIVERFKEDTFKILEEQPEKLAEVKGISEKMAMRIASAAIEQKDRRQAIIYLQKFGISMNLSLKIYEKYKDEVYAILKTNPYRLAEDISGVGFRIADGIAVRAGVNVDSDFRIRSGLLFVLSQAAINGNTCLSKDMLINETGILLGINMPDIESFLMNLSIEKKIIVKEEDDITKVYLMSYYYAELETARRLHDLNQIYEEVDEKLSTRLEGIEAELNIRLDEKQRLAFFKAVSGGLTVITGGPGTGKTTIIRSIIRYFEEENCEVLLAAPTGRAAKRMQEATEKESRTIHRLLEINRIDEDDNENTFFERNEANPLEADVIIIDEMSMVDINLMNSLLKAVAIGTRLILVGDADQLPSVGPGNVLKDIIESKCFTVVYLEKIFRQAAMSDIIVNAHKINAGEQVNPAKKSKDFLFIKAKDPDAAVDICAALVQDKLPKYVRAKKEDIQILTPMRKGPLGVLNLNEILQKRLNPPSPKKREKESGGVIYRVGDKVMQIKNNYKLEWEVRGRKGIVIDSGTGVFNGDTGIIVNINTFTEELDVEYEDGHIVTYDFKMLDELELAYAVTVHKSQGSEYPAVVLPLISGPRLLLNRNLLYTAVTRARSCVCIVGFPETFSQMISNDRKLNRFTGLKTRIIEISGDIDNMMGEIL